MMNNLLENKNILLLVTGSISAYKAVELLRLFVKSGAKVKVVISESAKRFVTPLTFEALSANTVLHEETESWANDNNHIAAAKWADLCVIAPATANTIAKLANNIADTLVTQVIAAFNGKIVLAPAANSVMYEKTLLLLEKLQNKNYIIANTQTKLLACGDIGSGALEDENEIFWLCAKELLKQDFWCGKNVIITGGGTTEAIDDVRFITNASSGKMANAIAKVAYLKGANVVLICANDTVLLPKQIKIIGAKSSTAIYENLQKVIDSIDFGYLFMAAAVSDFIPTKQCGKIKKCQIGDEWNLKLHKNIDILATINKTKLKTIGFKAETDKDCALQYATNMLSEKNLDSVVLNIIGVDTEFGADTTKLTLITKSNTIDLQKANKLTVANELLENISKI